MRRRTAGGEAQPDDSTMAAAPREEDEDRPALTDQPLLDDREEQQKPVRRWNSGEPAEEVPAWRRAARWAALVLLGPPAAVFAAAWWLMGRPRVLAALDLALALSCWLGAAYGGDAPPSEFFRGERGFGFSRSLLDVLLFVAARAGATLAVATVYRWRSAARTKLALALALAATALLSAKMAEFGVGGGHGEHWRGAAARRLARALVVAPLVLAWAGLVAELWVPTSERQLDEAERRLLRDLSYRKRDAAGVSAIEMVRDGDPSPSSSDSRPVMVLLHGYAGAKGMYIFNLEELSTRYRVLSLDLPGIGQSSRERFSVPHTAAAEEWFAERLEAWRAEVGLERFDVLVGHSFGGYIAGTYTLAHPGRVGQLVMASPAGMPDTEFRSMITSPALLRLLLLLRRCNVVPQSLLRYLGPLGPLFVRRAISFRYAHAPHVTERADDFAAYTYHANAGPPSGELAARHVFLLGAWPVVPLAPRMRAIRCPTLFLYGKHDWMDAGPGYDVRDDLRAKGVRCECSLLPRAGHQLFLENPGAFSRAVLDFCGGGGGGGKGGGAAGGTREV